MVFLNGNFYDWNTDALHRVTSRLLANDVLTINYKTEEAYINKYGKDPERIAYDYAVLMVTLQVVAADSGNLSTGEEHYNIKSR